MKLLQEYFHEFNRRTIKVSKRRSRNIDWNSKINVISRKDIDELYLRQEKFYL